MGGTAAIYVSITSRIHTKALNHSGGNFIRIWQLNLFFLIHDISKIETKKCYVIARLASSAAEIGEIKQAKVKMRPSSPEIFQKMRVLSNSSPGR